MAKSPVKLRSRSSADKASAAIGDGSIAASLVAGAEKKRAAKAARERESVAAIIQQWERERPDLDLEPMGLFGALARAYLLTTPHIDRLMAGHGLARGMFDVLAALRRAGPPYRLTPTQLSRSLMLSGSGMTNRLDRLESSRLISRLPDPTDRRGLQIQLTPKGLNLVDKVVPTLLAAQRDIVSGFGMENVKFLTVLLDQLSQKLMEGAGAEPSKFA